jgi:hypothetical protein
MTAFLGTIAERRVSNLLGFDGIKIGRKLQSCRKSIERDNSY